MKRPLIALLSLLLTSAILAGCGVFSGIGSDLGDGLGGSLSQRSDTIGAGLGGGLIRSVRDTLVADMTRQRLAHLVDSVINAAGLSANRGAVALRDSLLNATTRDWILGLERDLTYDLVLASAGLRDNLVGDQTRRQLAALRDELLSDRLGVFVAALRDTLTGPMLRAQIAALRNDLLGPETRAALDTLLAGVSADVKELTRGEESFLKRNITEILWTAGAIMALLLIVAGFVIVKVRKYKKMLETVTFQIHEMPNQNAYDNLTKNIQYRAKEIGVEPDLKKFLEKHGYVGQPSAAK